MTKAPTSGGTLTDDEGSGETPEVETRRDAPGPGWGSEMEVEVILVNPRLRR